MKAQVQSRASECGIVLEEVTVEQVSLERTSVSPVSTTLPVLHTHSSKADMT